MERFIGGVRRYASYIILFTLLCTAGFLSALPALEIHNPRENYELPDHDPVVRDFERLRERFGDLEVIILGIEFAATIGLQEMQVIARLTQDLAQLDGVSRVSSLANASQIDWQSFPPRVLPLYSERMQDPAEVGEMIRFATSEPPYASNLVSPDGRRSAILIEFTTHSLTTPEAMQRERRLVAQIQSAAEAARARFEGYYLAGLPLIDLAFEENLNRDLALFGGLSVIFALGVLVFLFRAWQPVVLASSLALLSLVWGLGVVSLTGTPLSVGLAMLVPLLLVISIAYSVHYLTFLIREENRSAPRDELIERMLHAVFLPSLLTGLTTACGFLALNASGLQGVREVGTYLAIGVLGCVYLNSIFLPALLFRLPAVRGGSQETGHLPFRIAAALGHLVVARTGMIIAVALTLAGISSLGVLRLRVDSNHLFYFPPDEAVRRDYHFIDEHFGGAIPLEILVTGPREELNAMAASIDRLAAELRALPGIGSVTSVVDLAKRRGPPNHGPAGDGFHALPTVLWEGIGASAFGRSYLLLDGAEATFRINSRAQVQGTHGLDALLRQVRSRLDAHQPGEGIVITGLAPIFVRTMDYIVSSQIYSFALAFGVILLIISLLTRSWRLGVITMLANTLPILLVLGAMGWLGIPLDISTVMIASVIIGIAVDDTIHFLYRFRRERQAALTIEAALTSTFRQVGSPLVISTLVFCGGFFVLVASSFVPIGYFGLLSGFTVLAALVGDLLLLPALLKALPRFY